MSATVPLAALPRLDPTAFDRQIPGMRRDLAIALIRSLPKTVRRAFVPAPDFADAALARIDDSSGRPLPDDLAAALTGLTGIGVTAASFDLDKIPPHLKMTIKVVDDGGRVVARGKDLATIQRTLRVDARRAVARMAPAVEETGLTSYPPGGVPRTVGGEVSDGAADLVSRNVADVVAYPALVDEGGTVGIRVFTSPSDQARAMRAGTRRLLVLGAGTVRKSLQSVLALRVLVEPAWTPGERCRTESRRGHVVGNGASAGCATACWMTR